MTEKKYKFAVDAQEGLRDLFREALTEVGYGTLPRLQAGAKRVDSALLTLSGRTLQRCFDTGPPFRETTASRAVLQLMAELTERREELMKAVTEFWLFVKAGAAQSRATQSDDLQRRWFQVILPQPTRDFVSVDAVSIDTVDHDSLSGRIARLSPPDPKETVLRWEFAGKRLGADALFLTFWSVGPQPDYRSRGTLSLNLAGQRGERYEGVYIRLPDDRNDELLTRDVAWRTDVPQEAFHYVALLDFDNTLSRGWSLRSWLAFLAAKEWPRAADALGRVDRLIGQFRRGRLSHDTLSTKCAMEYGQVLRGVPLRDVEVAAKDHSRDARHDVYDFTEPLIQALSARGIAPFILTGAPAEVVKYQAERLGVENFAALRIGVNEQGVYDGEPVDNPARTEVKAAIAERIGDSQRRTIVLAAGDSESDLPSLDAAENRLIVGDLGAAPWWRGGTVHRIGDPELADREQLAEWLNEQMPRGDFWGEEKV